MTNDTSARQPAAGDGDVEQRPASAGIGRTLLWRAMVGVTALTISVSASAWLLHAGIDPQADPWSTLPPRNTTLDAVRSWTKSAPDQQQISEDADLVVVDAWRIAKLTTATARAERVAGLKHRQDDGERLVLARLSLTQVCESDPQWRANWAASEIVTGTTEAAQVAGPSTSTIERHAAAARLLATGDRTWRVKTASAPSWLANADLARPGCWHVNFGDMAWLAHLAGSPQAMIEQLISDGIDGVLLDVDLESADRTERIQLRELIARVARRARDARNGFIVALGQGGEDLADRKLLRMLDAMAAAPLPDEATAAEAYQRRVRQLAQARADGVMVMISAPPGDARSGPADPSRIDRLGFVRQISSAAASRP